MKKNNFEAEYAEYQRIDSLYDAAEKAGDKEGERTAREQFQSLRENLLAKGDEYFRTFELYREAKDRGNAYIDLNEVIWDDKVAGLIENLRNLGIDHFTFSSTWSSAVETAWLFKENGCELEGLVQINSRYTSFRKNEYEKAAAYLFRVA